MDNRGLSNKAVISLALELLFSPMLYILVAILRPIAKNPAPQSDGILQWIHYFGWSILFGFILIAGHYYVTTKIIKSKFNAKEYFESRASYLRIVPALLFVVNHFVVKYIAVLFVFSYPIIIMSVVCEMILSLMILIIVINTLSQTNR